MVTHPDVVQDITPYPAKPDRGKGALGTWRSLGGPWAQNQDNPSNEVRTNLWSKLLTCRGMPVRA